MVVLIIDNSIKEQFDEQVIDSAFKKIIKSKTENMDIHFVYAGYYYWDECENRLKTFILEKMKKYEMKKVMLTIIYLNRERLITKEEMLDYCNGMEEEKKSVNDDLDSVFEGLRRGEEPWQWLNTYFFPQLTEEELDLVEEKDFDFMDTFSQKMNADVEKAQMAASESESKYVLGYGSRKTFTIEN